MCPKSSWPLYIVTYYIKWVTTSWTNSTNICFRWNGYGPLKKTYGYAKKEEEKKTIYCLTNTLQITTLSCCLRNKIATKNYHISLYEISNREEGGEWEWDFRNTDWR